MAATWNKGMKKYNIDKKYMATSSIRALSMPKCYHEKHVLETSKMKNAN
jgi:hypothetical protein